MLKRADLLILLLNDHGHLLGLRLKVDQSLLRLLQFKRNGTLHILIALADLSKLDLSIHFVLLHLILQLLLPLLRLVQGDLLLQCTVFHLLILEQQGLDLALQLLQHQFVVLHHHLQVVGLGVVELGGHRALQL